LQRETNLINALGHNFVWTQMTPPTCIERGEDTGICSRAGCSQTNTRIGAFPLGHSFGAWSVTTLPSAVSEGVETTVCQRENCLHYETRSIPNRYTLTFNSMGGSDVAPILNILYGSIIQPPIPTSGYGTFENWYYDSARNMLFNFSTPITSNLALFANWDAFYDIGNEGPGGGTIFYRNETGFIMADTEDRAHYLEASPFIPVNRRWSYAAIYIIGTERQIGAGRRNTALILALDPTAPAALFCENYSNNGLNDWFLPSRDELAQLYTERLLVGNLSSLAFWSSTQTIISDAWRHNFVNNWVGGWLKTDEYRVLPIRAF
jgi:hypothetical protein